MGAPPTIFGKALNVALMKGSFGEAAARYAEDAEIHTASGRVIRGRPAIEEYLAKMLDDVVTVHGVVARDAGDSHQQPEDYSSHEGLWEVSRTIVTWDYTNRDGHRRRLERLFVRHLDDNNEFVREYTCAVPGSIESFRGSGRTAT